MGSVYLLGIALLFCTSNIKWMSTAGLSRAWPGWSDGETDDRRNTIFLDGILVACWKCHRS